MNRRERVWQAIHHQETDFVPYNFHAVPGVWQKVCRHYGLTDTHEAMEFIGNHIVKVGSDFNYNPWADEVGRVELTVSGGPVHTALDSEGGLHRDEFGCLWDRTGSLPHPVAYPLAEKPDLHGYTFPDPYRQGRFDQARELADRYRGEVFLFGKLGMALFERAWSIRGMTQLLMDMVERPEFVEELLDRILTEWNLPIIDQQLALGVDGFYFADDWGSKTGLIFSPRMWRRFIKPRLAVMYQRCREAGVVVAQHSDGAVGVLFPDLIEIGLQVFNPLSPSVMDPPTVKAQYGDRLCFYGGIDVERTLPFGTPEEVRGEMRHMAELMGRGGGYILQSSHTILDDVPLANLVAYIEEVRQMAGLT
ncbi:MAG: uroporphyrinogen decarboxylase family protein [Anaerolineae bacterium]|nr:uroporphyrinogen decarboxylase family protein [Anaerolineae bacterium]